MTSGLHIAILVADMYIETITSQKKYITHYLRESYRENGKVKHKTIANISHCSPEEIEALRLALKHKHSLVDIAPLDDVLSLHQGPSVGALLVLREIAERVGITESLGSTRDGKLALWQILSRVIDQGSRLSATRLASSHGVCDILGLDSFNEEHLYKNLDWTCSRQALIEDRLFRTLHGDNLPELFLYDVTSSYLEGTHNELAAFGYNRDRKNGKPQIVIGLLSDQFGFPLSIEVFEGNTGDTGTFANQIKKVSERFGGGVVTLVGDRGMIKSRQMTDLQEHGFHGITAITKAQIETLMNKGVVQLEFFEDNLVEIESDGHRYILRRNSERAKEMKVTRENKRVVLEKAIEKGNAYLETHPKAKVTTIFKRVTGKAQRLKMKAWITITTCGRKIGYEVQADGLQEAERFDGCYVLKTDVPMGKMSKEEIHSRYKDLALIEQTFRTCKTGHLELRPIHVRLGDHTRAHVFIVMLAFRLVQELRKCWWDVDVTVEEGIAELSRISAVEIRIKGKTTGWKFPQPSELGQQLLEKAGVKLPKGMPSKGIKVTSRKKPKDWRKPASGKSL